MILNPVGLAASQLFAEDLVALRVLTAAFVLAFVNNAWLWWGARDERRYRPWRVTVYFAVAPVFNAGVLYGVGVFGPVLAMFVFNVYASCLAYPRRIARLTLIGSAAPVVALGGAITLGWISDPGPISFSAHVGTPIRVSFLALFAVFIGMVYTQARRTRELMVSSLAERDEAVRRASHREALFLEARQDLERALQAGGLGRFTEQTLGSFKLGAVLGRGGMGEVYEAAHRETGAPAAVKLLLPEVLGRPESVRRFLREVRIAASLDSPHVVKVLEVGDESAALPYLAMERLVGEDLAQILRREERLPAKDVVELVRQVAQGLGVAAAAGIVHRDLKPHNLFRTEPDGTWKILDFGVSKRIDGGNTLTADGMVGTPLFMAPEQARGVEVDARADIYGLAAVAYRALTGHPLFRGDDLAQVVMAIVSRMPIRPSALVKVPREVDAVLAIGLAKSPSDRFARADELADALAGALEGRLAEPLARRAAAVCGETPWSETIVRRRR